MFMEKIEEKSFVFNEYKNTATTTKILLTFFFPNTKTHTGTHVYGLYAHKFLLFCIFNINGFDKKEKEEKKIKTKQEKRYPTHSLTRLCDYFFPCFLLAKQSR